MRYILLMLVVMVFSCKSSKKSSIDDGHPFNVNTTHSNFKRSDNVLFFSDTSYSVNRKNHSKQEVSKGPEISIIKNKPDHEYKIITKNVPTDTIFQVGEHNAVPENETIVMRNRNGRLLNATYYIVSGAVVILIMIVAIYVFSNW